MGSTDYKEEPTSPAKGWARVGFALNESFSAALEKHTDNCEYVIKLADEKLFGGRFKGKMPSRKIIKAGSLVTTFSAAALLTALEPKQAFGVMAFGAAAVLQKIPQNSNMRMMVTVVSSLNAVQYAINDNLSGLAMTGVNAARATALTYISDDNISTRYATALIFAGGGLTMVLAGAAANPNRFLVSSLPAASVTLGAAADVLPDDKSRLARVLRTAVHSCNAAYDTLESGNIGGIATNAMILKNIRAASIEQKDFPPAINDNNEKVGFSIRLKTHIKELSKDIHDVSHDILNAIFDKSPI